MRSVVFIRTVRNVILCIPQRGCVHGDIVNYSLFRQDIRI